MSNKTAKKQPNETESAHKPVERSPKKLIFGILIIFVGLWVLYGGITSLFDNTRRLLAPNGFITVEVVDTFESRQLGLSGRDRLEENQGMLFEFVESSQRNCFWMKDMKFSIDMVWMNEDRKVVTVIPDVSPETYPENFCPESEAKFGLELASGRAETLEIVPGETLRW